MAASLREFLDTLEHRGELRRVRHNVDPKLEITEVCRRVLRAGGPALLFEQPGAAAVPLLANLFGSGRRVALALGRERVEDLRELGGLLARLRQPAPPRGLGALVDGLPAMRRLLGVAPRTSREAPCQEQRLEGGEVDLFRLPLQILWPGDAGPLITFGLTITRCPERRRHNLGVYRLQVLERDRLIVRWLAHRGGAADHRAWCRHHPDQPFPIAVAIGADPALTLAAVTPIPDTLSEYEFAGLLRGSRTELARSIGHDLCVPAQAEIVLEGAIHPGEEADEGPFGDHTGYYDTSGRYPVMRVERITHRRAPVYHGTFTGRAPEDEPSVLAAAMNELFVPLLQAQFPEIVDFFLPPAACSYRLAVVAIDKQYPGHARQIMFGIWSYLRQFSYTKMLVVTDADIDVRDWDAVLWALSTRMDPARDTVIVERTPVDDLDFASPAPGLGSKIGFDATNKWPAETNRTWGEPLAMTPEVERRIDAIWAEILA